MIPPPPRSSSLLTSALFFFFNDTATTEIYTLSLHDALPISLVSVKGPSITVRFPPENRTRLPFELAWSPSAASSTPAFTSSSLYFPISARSFWLGRTPASESLLALTITMNRIGMSPFEFELRAGFPDGLDRVNLTPTLTSNDGQ